MMIKEMVHLVTGFMLGIITLIMCMMFFGFGWSLTGTETKIGLGDDICSKD